MPHLTPGDLPLDAAAAHHLIAVLRLGDGAEVEAFDDGGHLARAVLRLSPDGAASLHVESVEQAVDGNELRLAVASAVPKGERADWMVEKLSELGVARFIPLATARSVVHPEGRSKRERWARLASEAARQSRRAGVMQIDELTPLPQAIASLAQDHEICCLSTTAEATPIQALLAAPRAARIALFIGPEGGWAPEEIERMQAAGARSIALTQTVLRVETAAVAGTAILLTCVSTHD